jgi:hypothetical protein
MQICLVIRNNMRMINVVQNKLQVWGSYQCYQ